MQGASSRVLQRHFIRLTGQKKTREGDHVKLRHRDIIAVHEEVQQVDGEVSGCGTQPEAVADDGDEVCEVSPQVELRGLAFVGRQLELLLEQHVAFEISEHTDGWWLKFSLVLFCYNTMYTQKYTH